MDLVALAAKWRVDPRDAAVDDAPVREPMRQGVKPMHRRAPSADQKRVRREMGRSQARTASADEYACGTDHWPRTVGADGKTYVGGPHALGDSDCGHPECPYQPCDEPICEGFPEGEHSRAEHHDPEWMDPYSDHSQEARRLLSDAFGGEDHEHGSLLDHNHREDGTNGPSRYSVKVAGIGGKPPRFDVGDHVINFRGESPGHVTGVFPSSNDGKSNKIEVTHGEGKSFGYEEAWNHHPDASAEQVARSHQRLSDHENAKALMNSIGGEDAEWAMDQQHTGPSRYSVYNRPEVAQHLAAAVHPLDKVGYDWSDGEHAGWAPCEDCGDGWDHHPAQYSHEGRYGEGHIFASVCPQSGLTDYRTREGIVKDSEVPKKHKVGAPSSIGPFLAPETRRQRKKMGLDTQATRQQIGVANSMGQILLAAGDQIRMPTGQSVTVKNVRRHETSHDHYYVDTDAGTTVVPWSTQFDVVRGGQQQVLPGPGISGGNFGDMPGMSGNVEDLQHSKHQQQNTSSPNDCPSCKSKGALVRRGGKFQCMQCGFTQNPQGGGHNFSDATQQYVSKIKDTRSAISRRCAAVLAQPDPNQKESL